MGERQYIAPSSRRLGLVQTGNAATTPYAPPAGTIKQFNESYRKFCERRNLPIEDLQRIRARGARAEDYETTGRLFDC